MSSRHTLVALMGASLLALCSAPALAGGWGPYNAEFPAAGGGLHKDIRQGDLFGAGVKGFTLSAWVKPSEASTGKVPVAGLGNGPDGGWFIETTDGKLAFTAPGIEVTSKAALKPGAWTLVTVTSDGKTVRLYADGKAVAETKAAISVAPAKVVQLAPRTGTGAGVFAGKIAGFTLSDSADDAKAIKKQAATKPDDDLIVFDSGSPTWPIQVRQMYGQQTPQDAWTLPQGKAPFDKPVAKPAYAGPVLAAGDHDTAVIKTWYLSPAPDVTATPQALSTLGFNVKSWYQATTPGTVLTTLVDRGVYPDPDHGLNNMAIPERLSHQDYWYRSEFAVPASYVAGRHLFVTFKGINYAAEAWVNGQAIGNIKGAFIRGTFDISPYVKPGQTAAIAVRVSPVPHPGIAQEESLTAGSGNNGGAQAQDGPTFVASEGWDWIPSVRDRNTGLWQDVVLQTTGDIRLGDAHIITALPQKDGKTDTHEADISIDVPVSNLSATPVKARVEATITAKDGTLAPVVVTQDVTLAPGETSVSFTPKTFAALMIQHPKLWWPNGYGAPDLHVLNVKVYQDGKVSDSSDTRFGIRQVTYELSLYNPTGHLDRVEADYTKGRELGIRITDGRNSALHRIADLYGTNDGSWATSLRAEAQGTAAAVPLSDTSLTPYLVIKVNGVRIAARGGSWGTDDWRKRVSRDNLEPYFRLHRDANVNVIRNWVGQNTEDEFYDLADEYGLMVLNDFWASTQDYQLEPQDVDLFLANARDVITRYRNHPSIVVWFGRNEGVPQPPLNEGLENLVYQYDGTRWYTGSSNRVNLQNSGPYSYKTPASYFTEHARGFSVEVGTASFPTLESFQAAVSEADQWPISDSWTYHDWHPDGNGSTKPFEAAMAAEFGDPTSLADFDRKAQMLNYDNHRAIFEGMNAGLWTRNSGRLLWMTQPAWPSTQWQILSHDYDTQASFYGVKSAAEPVHVQMNLPDLGVIVVNNPTADLSGATVTAEVYGLDGKLLSKASQPVSVKGVAVSAPIDFGLMAQVAAQKVVVIKLALSDAGGKPLSRNVYWQGVDPAALKALNDLPQEDLTVALTPVAAVSGKRLSVTLSNPSDKPVLEAKLTLVDDKGQRILPAYYSDNYVSLMPGESRTVTIDYNSGAPAGVALRGWNVKPKTVH